MKKNNKGFTLIELLAVIVVLAIIMVIATQQINKTISRTRANSMISTLKMAANGVKTKQADGSIAACVTGKKCLEDVVDYDTDDYTINVSGDSSAWKVTVTATSSGEFEKADFNLVSGYSNGKFGPNDLITREQLAVILNNYCKYNYCEKYYGGKNILAK